MDLRCTVRYFVRNLLVAAGLASVPGLLHATDAAAQDNSRMWSLDELVDALRRANPQLEQARQTWLAAQQQVAQAKALPNAQFNLAEQANTGGPFDFNRNSGFYAYYTLTQPLLWPGKRRLNGEIAGEQAAAVGTQYDALLVQLTASLKLAYYQLLASCQQRQFMDEDVQRLRQMKDAAQIRYANNAAAYVDFMNAQVAESSLENDRYALDRQIQSVTEQINTLLARPPQSALELRAPEIQPHLPAKPLESLVTLAMQTNPTLAGDRHQLDAADKSVALADKAFLPDFQVSAGVYTDPTLIHLETARMYSIGVGINLPTWGFAKEKAGLRQARAQLDAACANQDADRQQVAFAVSNAYHELETALKQTTFVRNRLLPQAQAAWHLALTGYAAGGSTAFSDLLAAQSGLRATELNLLQSRSGALQAYANLTAAIGHEPD